MNQTRTNWPTMDARRYATAQLNSSWIKAAHTLSAAVLPSVKETNDFSKSTASVAHDTFLLIELTGAPCLDLSFFFFIRQTRAEAALLQLGSRRGVLLALRTLATGDVRPGLYLFFKARQTTIYSDANSNNVQCEFSEELGRSVWQKSATLMLKITVDDVKMLTC